MKNTIILFCLSLFALQADGQVIDTTEYKKMTIKIPLPSSLGCIYQKESKDRDTAKPVVRRGCIDLIAYKNVSVDFDAVFSTPDKTIYTREDFKEFGIWNFPNIWH